MRVYYGKVVPTDHRYVYAFFIADERVGSITAHERHHNEIVNEMKGAEFIHQPRNLSDWFHLGPPLTPQQREQMEYDLERMGP